jgi:hypothetical protein
MMFLALKKFEEEMKEGHTVKDDSGTCVVSIVEKPRQK